MVVIDSEGKFNENSYLFDGKVMNIPHFLSIYIIENDGLRLMIDTPQEQYTRKFIKKLRENGAYPIHKILLTHSHFDHISGVNKLKKLVKETEIEVLASENAIDNLLNPERMNDEFSMSIPPIENVTPLKDQEIVNLGGLELEVLNFFGHTMDSISVFDKKNKNLFTGDSIGDRYDRDTFAPVFMPPDFNEPEFLKTLKRAKKMREIIDSLSLAHFGVWKNEDKDNFLNGMEELYYKSGET